MHEDLFIGENRLMVEGDTVHVIDSRGWSRLEMETILALFERLHAQHGHVYVMSEAKRSPTVSPEARHAFAMWNRDHRVDGIVIYGGSLAIRALLTLVSRAAELTSGRRILMHMVATEAEARRYIAEHRAQRSPSS